MYNVKELITENVLNKVKVHCSIYGDFFIYKGFKVKMTDYVIYDVTIEKENETEYSYISHENYKILTELGFIKGADFICHKRNIKRIKSYEEEIFKLIKQKQNIKSGRKLKLIQNKITYNADMLVIYTNKVKKYNKFKQ